jgi:hypothetical protein
MYQASVFVIVINFLFALTNRLAYYLKKLITTVKSFMIQTPGQKINIKAWSLKEGFTELGSGLSRKGPTL